MADFPTAPWPAPTAGHSNSLTKRTGGRHPAKVAKTAQIPLNARILYSIRFMFMFTSDLCGEWSSFGGIPAQMNNPSITPSWLLMKASPQLRRMTTFRQLTWKSFPAANSAVNFADLLSVGNPKFNLHAMAHAPEAPTAPNTRQEEKGKE